MRVRFVTHGGQKTRGNKRSHTVLLYQDTTTDRRANVWKIPHITKGVTKLLLKNGSKAALLTSFSLFAARQEPTWVSPPPLIAY